MKMQSNYLESVFLKTRKPIGVEISINTHDGGTWGYTICIIKLNEIVIHLHTETSKNHIQTAEQWKFELEKKLS